MSDFDQNASSGYRARLRKRFAAHLAKPADAELPELILDFGIPLCAAPCKPAWMNRLSGSWGRV